MPSNPWAWAEDDGKPSPSSADSAVVSKELSHAGSSGDISYVDGDALLSQLTRLQVETEMDDTDVAAIFSILNQGLQTEASFQVLLFLLPESQHGLHPITSGLLHGNTTVRKYAVRLLQRMELFFSTRPAFANMNKFIKNAFDRQVDIQLQQTSA